MMFFFKFCGIWYHFSEKFSQLKSIPLLKKNPFTNEICMLLMYVLLSAKKQSTESNSWLYSANKLIYKSIRIHSILEYFDKPLDPAGRPIISFIRLVMLLIPVCRFSIISSWRTRSSVILSRRIPISFSNRSISTILDLLFKSSSSSSLIQENMRICY